jgi:O-antigen/teichoic acid export membrane protein
MGDLASESTLPDDKQRMIRGSILMTLNPITALFLGIIISILINQFIPAENYAIFSWFNIMNSFLITIIPFRFPGAIVRYLAYAKGGKNQEDINGLLKTNTVLSLILIPVSGIVALVATPIFFDISIGIGGLYSYLDIIIFAVGIMSLNLSTFTVAAMKGLQEFDKIGIAQVVANIISQVTVIVLIIQGIGITALIIKWAIAGILTTLLLALTIRKIWSLQGKLYPLRPLLSFAYPGIVSFLFAFLFQEFLVRFIFQSFISELGLYEFAVRMLSFVTALTIGFYSALGPYYAQALGRGDATALEREVQWTVKISFFLFLPLIVGIVAISPALFLLLFENYYWSYQYFVILMIQPFLYLFYRPFIAILNSIAKTKLVLIISATSSIVSGLLMILSVNYGVLFVLTGYVSNVFLLVVLAYVSSVFFSALQAGLWVKHILGISLGIRRVTPLIIIAVSLIFPAVIIHFFRLPPLIELPVILGLFVFLYTILVRLLRLITANEIRKATLFLPKRLADPLAISLIKIFVRKEKK